MKDSPHRTPECIDAETLADFLEGRLDSESSARLEHHFSACEDCYEALIEAAHVQDELALTSNAGETTPSTVASVWRTKRVLYAAAGLAAALAVAVWLPTRVDHTGRRVDSGMNRLITAVGTNRFTVARLSEPFAWGPPPTFTRGSGTEPASAAIEVQQAALALQTLAQARESGSSVRAAGISLLALGRVDQAIDTLSRAVRLAPSDARTQIDLSAALLERARRTGSQADAEQALAHTDMLLRTDGTNQLALFNKALALETLGRAEPAAAAWRQYLGLDSTSSWADEARAHAARLTGSTAQRASFEIL